MKRLFVLWIGLLLTLGCQSKPAVGDPSKKVTWEEFQKMPSEDQADPYILKNLDDTARQKFDELVKRQHGIR